MREIKFRAWDLDYKQMDDHFYIHSKGAVYESANRTYDTPNIEIDENPNLIIMQFIGRQDSNYNDLYEGDVIHDHVGRGVIKWWEANNAFKVSYVDENKGYGKWFADYTLKELESILKVGNIHENPELLESVK
jgi:uncharacterized phage protein (TIGR01671 family)